MSNEKKKNMRPQKDQNIEKVLMGSGKKYRTLLKESNVGIYKVTPGDKGKFIDVNPALVNILGYRSKKEVLELNVSDIYINPSDRKRFSKKMSENGFLKNEELHLKKKDGTTILAYNTGIAVHDKNGEIVYFEGILEDVTERKKVEKALRESEELYRKLIETSPDSITLNDMDGKMVMANQAAVEMRGYRNEGELLRKNMMELIAPQDIEKAKKGIKETLETEKVRDVEYALLKKDGTTFFADVSVSIIKDAEGNPNLFMAVVRDITERKSIEKALKESEEQYRMLVETSPDSISVFDLNGNLIMSNPATYEVYGNGEKVELIGESIFNFIQTQDKKRVAKEIEEVIKTGNLKKGDYKIVNKEGKIFFVETSVSLIKDADGVSKGLMAITRDVTKRKKMENDLAAEKERLSVTLRSIAESVISVDIKGNVVFMNEVAEQLTGWAQADAIGKPLRDVLNVVDNKNKPIACHEIVKNVIEKGDISCTVTIDEGTLIAKDETEKIIAQSCAPIRGEDNNIQGVVLIIRDITEKQKLEKELFRATKLESIGLLAGGIAHDFNNILTGITSSLFMAKMSLEKDTSIYKFILEAEKAAFRASRLTNQLITFAKGGAPIKEIQSIREIIEEAVGFSLSGSNIDCELKLPEDLWTAVIDRGQIDQVITNLIINAEQAMPAGGTITLNAENITIDGTVPRETTAYIPLNPGKYIKISVKDEGVGILPEDLESIYDPYFTTKDSGSGLGLTICYSIIRKHNGFIYAKSRLGIGTTFHVYLPVSGKKFKKPEKNEEKVPLTGTGKILVMDDEDVVRITAGQILKTIGYMVEYAKDGHEAIRVYKKAIEKEQPFDAVIMDLTIPGGMGGREAVQKLIEIDPDVRAIVTSGYSNDPIMANFKEHGFSGVISKPYMVDEFNAVIRRAISKKK